jgi:hypothetical protein
MRLPALLLALLVAACGGRDALVAKPDEALVVFIRPGMISSTGAYQPTYGVERPVSVHDVSEGIPGRLVGQVGISEKIAYAVKPGRHRFIVLGPRTGDVLEASVQAGRTYYAVIFRELPKLTQNPMLAIYTVRPVRASALDRREVVHWVRDTSLVRSADGGGRAGQNVRIESQLQRQNQQWENKSPAERAAKTLRASDGH